MQIDFDKRDLPRLLWLACGLVMLLILLVLYWGLGDMSELPPDAKQELKELADSIERPQHSNATGLSGGVMESKIVAEARNFALRWSEVPALPPAPADPPRPIAKAKPAPPPPPPAPPKPALPEVVVKPDPKPVEPPEPQRPPAPSFKLLGTLMIGQADGLIWVELSNKGKPEPFGVGEQIQDYRVEQVRDGYAVFSREGFDYRLEVMLPESRSIEADQQGDNKQALSLEDNAIDLSPINGAGTGSSAQPNPPAGPARPSTMPARPPTRIHNPRKPVRPSPR